MCPTEGYTLSRVPLRVLSPPSIGMSNVPRESLIRNFSSAGLSHVVKRDYAHSIVYDTKPIVPRSGSVFKNNTLPSAKKNTLSAQPTMYPLSVDIVQISGDILERRYESPALIAGFMLDGLAMIDHIDMQLGRLRLTTLRERLSTSHVATDPTYYFFVVLEALKQELMRPPTLFMEVYNFLFEYEKTADIRNRLLSYITCLQAWEPLSYYLYEDSLSHEKWLASRSGVMIIEQMRSDLRLAGYQPSIVTPLVDQLRLLLEGRHKKELILNIVEIKKRIESKPSQAHVVLPEE